VIRSDGTVSMTVMGSHFPEAACYLRIGGLLVTSIRISNSQIEYHGSIDVPAGYTSLEVSFNSVEFFAASTFILAIGQISVSSILPSTVGAEGGSLVTAHGGNFSAFANISCVFGDEQTFVPSVVYSPSVLTCKTPASRIGSSFVRVSIFASDFVSFRAPIRVVNHPLLRFVSPSIGSALGGTMVTLNGEQFFDDIQLHCIVEGVRVPAKIISDSMATCFTPYVGSNRTGTISLEASVLSNQNGNSIPFLFFSFPESIGISPSLGPSRGGLNVFISGWTFPVEISVCRFGHVLSPMKTFGLHKVCESPQLDAGLYDLALSPNGCDFSHGAPFRVFPKAEHVQVLPSLVNEKGGRSITVSGVIAQIFDEIFCRFDSGINNGTSAGRVSSSNILCVPPPLPPSKYSLSLQINGLILEFDQVFVEVTPSIVLDSLHPSTAFLSGGSIIVARGLHLNSSRSLYCHFGRAPPIAFVARSEFEGSCTSPAHEIGIVDFQIATIDQHDNSRVFDFLFVLQPVIMSINPSVVVQDHVVTFNVSGSNFADHGGVYCSHGSNSSGSGRGLITSSTFLQCSMSFSECGVFDFFLSLNGHDVVPSGLAISVTPSETVHRVLPSWGSHAGGTSVSIFGSNFRVSSKVHVKFGVSACLCSFQSVTLLICSAPGHPIGDVGISTSNDGVLYKESRVMYSYRVSFEISRIHPSVFSPNDSKTLVTISGGPFYEDGSILCRLHDAVFMGIYLSPEEVICQLVYSDSTPPGKHEVYISNNGADYSVGPRVLLINQDILISYVYPSVLPRSASVFITIVGSGFVFNETGFMLGPFMLPNCSYASGSKSICATAVNISQGITSVSAFMGLKTSQSSVLIFEQPVLSSLSSAYLSDIGGETITISGSGFIHSPLVSCLFGSKRVQGLYVSSTTCLCQVPALDAGNILVSLSFDGQSTTNYIIGNVIPVMSVKAVIPSVGFVSLGGVVTVSGSGFINSSMLRCLFGDAATFATFYTDAMVVCSLPGSYAPSTVVINLHYVNGFRSLSAVSFDFIPSPIMTSVFPSFGSHSGSQITLIGENFDPRSTFYIGESSCKRLQVQKNQVICVTNNVTLGKIEIYVVAGSTSVTIGHWESHISAEVIDVVPKEVILSAKNVITIHGYHFISSEMLCCMFGKSLEMVHATYISKLQISCTIPMWLSGNSTVAVSNNCADFSVWNETLVLMKSTFNFFSLEPTSGVSSGGSKITVCGQAVKYSHLQLRLGAVKIEVHKILHSDCMAFLSPPLQPGIYAVDVYWSDSWVPSVAGFECITVPLIQFVQPLVGIVGRQSTFFIQGTNLIESRMSCCFLDSCVKFVQKNMKLSCLSPKTLTGGINLAIKFDSVVVSDTFQLHFMNSFTINGITPSSGSHRGGIWVTVYLQVPSTPFPLSCRFGHMVAIAEIVSSSELRCMLPRSSPGLVHFDLVIENNIEMNTNEVFFQLITDSIVTDVIPSYGFSSTHSLTIFGENFQQNAVVSVSGGVVSTLFANSSCLICTIGSLSLGEHEVTVKGVSSVKFFSVIMSLHFTTLVPQEIPLRTGTHVTVFGAEFPHLTGSCLIGSHSSVLEVINSNQIVCKSVFLTSPQIFNVIIAFQRTEHTDSGLTLSAHPSILVTRLNPTSGSSLGGTRVTIHGRGIQKNRAFRGKFGTEIVTCFPVEDDIGVCVLPRLGAAGNVSVLIGIGDIFLDYMSHPGVIFSVEHCGSISALIPRRSPVHGGIPITVYGSGFTQSSVFKCSFGGRMAIGTFASASEVICISPQFVPGATEFSFFADDNLLSGSGTEFYYDHVPVIISVFPTSGPSIGLTSVTISGFGFRSVLPSFCVFSSVDGVANSSASIVSDSLVTCMYFIISAL
jgi:hypothetical protein